MVLQQDQEKRFDTELFIIPHTNENEDKLYPPGPPAKGICDYKQIALKTQTHTKFHANTR